MADSYATTIASQHAQQAQSEDYNDDFANSMRRQNDVSYGGGAGGYGATPSYQGVLPARDYGFEEFLGHHLNSTSWGPDGKARDGVFQGLNRSQAQEKARDLYGNMSPEDRSQWESRRFMQNDRSPQELKDQGFQYSDQTDKWGSKGTLNQPPSYRPEMSHDPDYTRNLSTMPTMAQPNLQPEARVTPSYAPPVGSSRAIMGDPSDTARYGPRMTSPQFDMQGSAMPKPTIAPAPAMASVGR